MKRKVVKRTVSSTTPIRPRYLESRKPHSAQEVQQYGTYQYKVDPTYSLVDYQNTINTTHVLENKNPPQSTPLSHPIHLHQTFPIEGERNLLVKGKSSTCLNFHVNDSVTYVSCLDLNPPKDSSFQTKDKNATLPQLVGVTRTNNLGNKLPQESKLNKFSSPKSATEYPFGNFFTPLNSLLLVKPIQFVART